MFGNPIVLFDDEVPPARELVCRVNPPLGDALGFHDRVEDLNSLD